MAAKRTNKVEVEIVAIDEASPKIDRLEQKIDGLESDEARIIVSANTERLEKQLDTARQKLEGLDGDEATVQARLIGNLEADLEQAQTLLSRLDGQTGTVRISALDTATKDLEQVEDKLRRLDGKVADVGVHGEKAGGLGVGGKVGGVAAIGASLVGAITTANQLAGDVQQVADATGAPLDQAARLVTVWEQNGLEVADLLDILFQVNSALADNPELAEQLGVKIGENQSLIDTFLQSVKGVATEYENVSDRQIAASQLFGEEGVRQIGAVTTAVGDLDTAMRELPEAALIDPADVERWRQTNEQVVEFKQHLLEVELFLSEHILPAVNDIAEGIGKWFDWVGTAGERTAAAFDAVADFALGGTSSNLAERGVIARNTAGYTGGAVAMYDDAGNYIRAPVGTTSHAPPGGYPRVTIINPPGTPPATADQLRQYDERNGPR
jgi:hypothetical protein